MVGSYNGSKIKNWWELGQLEPATKVPEMNLKGRVKVQWCECQGPEVQEKTRLLQGNKSQETETNWAGGSLTV